MNTVEWNGFDWLGALLAVIPLAILLIGFARQRQRDYERRALLKSDRERQAHYRIVRMRYGLPEDK